MVCEGTMVRHLQSMVCEEKQPQEYSEKKELRRRIPAQTSIRNDHAQSHKNSRKTVLPKFSEALSC